MHARGTGLHEDRLRASVRNPNIDLTWKYINPPCRNWEIDFTLKQKSVPFFSQTHHQIHHRHVCWGAEGRGQGSRANNVQPDKTVLLSPSPSKSLLLALLYDILPQHLHSLQPVENIISRIYIPYLLNSTYIYVSTHIYMLIGYA